MNVIHFIMNFHPLHAAVGGILVGKYTDSVVAGALASILIGRYMKLFGHTVPTVHKVSKLFDITSESNT